MDTLITMLTVLGIPGVILAVVVYLLHRGGASKRLALDEQAVGITKFEALNKSALELLDRAEKNLVDANRSMDARVKALEEADRHKSIELDSANQKIELLRRLLTSYIQRTGVPLTADESSVFEHTAPSPRLKQNRGI